MKIVKFLSVCTLFLTNFLAFGQKDTASVYYMSSNLNYIIRMSNSDASVYNAAIVFSSSRKAVSPKRITVSGENKLKNSLHDAASPEQLSLFYTGEKFAVEKKNEGFVLKRINKHGTPLITQRLIPFGEEAKMSIVAAINDYQRFSFLHPKLDTLVNQFEDYCGYWETKSIQAKLDLIPSSLPPGEYEVQLNLFETALCDSLWQLNETYSDFLERLKTDTPEVSEVMEIYNDIKAKYYDFELYGMRLVEHLADYQPPLYFQVAEQFDVPKERRAYFLTLNPRRMSKMNKVEADASLRSDFHKARRFRVMANVVLFTVEFIVILGGAFLLSL